MSERRYQIEKVVKEATKNGTSPKSKNTINDYPFKKPAKARMRLVATLFSVAEYHRGSANESHKT